jgi:hypothetical protein
MRLLRRFVAALVLLLSAAGIVCCVAGIVGIWAVFRDVSDRIGRMSDGLDAGLQRVSLAGQNAQRAVDRARADVANVSKESGDLGAKGEKGRRASRAVRALIQQQAGPNIDDVGGRLATLSDAAAAVSSLLQSFQELPLGERLRLEPEALQQRADDARQLSATLRRLEASVGDGDNEVSGQEVAAATSQVDVILRRCEEAVRNWQSDVEAAREGVARVKARVLGWLTWAAIALTALLAWVGLGQVSLFAHALRWCKGSGGVA